MNPTTMTPGQKNAHYRKINNRFDERCGILIGMGFKQESMESHGFNILTRRCPWNPTKIQSIPSAVLLYADELVWADHLDSLRGV